MQALSAIGRGILFVQNQLVRIWSYGVGLYAIGRYPLAEEWLGLTFSNNKDFIARVKNIMLMSREAGVNYRSPWGLRIYILRAITTALRPGRTIKSARIGMLPIITAPIKCHWF